MVAEGVEPVEIAPSAQLPGLDPDRFSAGAGEVDESPNDTGGGRGDGCWAAKKAGKTIDSAAGARKPSLIYDSS